MKTAAVLIAMVAVTGLLSGTRAQFDSCPISQDDLNARDFRGMQDACQGDFSTEDACDECLVSTFEPVVDLLDYIPITDTTTEEDVRNQIRSLLDVCQDSLLSAIQQDLPLNVLFGIRGAQSCSLPEDSEGYPRVTGVIRAYYEARGLRLPQ
eukprot:jgi/Picsp_1/4029/NSC_01541-R1_---NA---